LKKLLKENSTILALIGLMIILSFLSPVFFTPRNLTNLARQVTVIGIMSVGMTMVILLGGIDLSVGSIVGLAAVTVTLLMQAGLSITLAIILTILLVGVGIGLWNGFWIAKYDIPPFIITLGMMTIARGLALTLTQGVSIPVTAPAFSFIGGGYINKVTSLIILGIALIVGIYSILKAVKRKKANNIEVSKINTFSKFIFLFLGIFLAFFVFIGYRGIPIPVIILVVFVALGVFILRKTKLGRRLYAIGGNENVAWLSGINIFKTKMFVFSFITTLAAIGGIILASRLNGASPNLGKMFELDTIASVVIGGTSLSGGFGTVTGSIIGAFIIGVINNGMSLMGINTFYQLIVKGLIIIFAVWVDIMNKKQRS